MAFTDADVFLSTLEEFAGAQAVTEQLAFDWAAHSYAAHLARENGRIKEWYARKRLEDGEHYERILAKASAKAKHAKRDRKAYDAARYAAAKIDPVLVAKNRARALAHYRKRRAVTRVNAESTPLDNSPSRFLTPKERITDLRGEGQ